MGGLIIKVNLPLWFIKARKPQFAPGREPCDEPNALLAYTSREKLTAFLDAQGAGSWELSLIANCESLAVLVSEARGCGAIHVCVNPNPDGSGGMLLKLSDMQLMAAL